MIIVILSDQYDTRKATLADVLAPYGEAEILQYDDTSGTVRDLEQFAYPSLFNTGPSIVRATYILESSTDVCTASFIATLVASPTIFVFEEQALPAAFVAVLKKGGALIYATPKQKVVKKEADIFVVTKALTASDKKSRWLIYRAALGDHPVEALVGIMYWKLKDLIAKDPSHSGYRDLYTKLITAHARAWQSGAPLEVAIEKVLLQ
jgi:hypothetical protein